VYQRNILRYPEQSFTFDKKLMDKERLNFNFVIVSVPELGVLLEISKDDFFANARLYNYGNGSGYRVATKYFTRRGKQEKLM
jgi:hypothetical protein